MKILSFAFIFCMLLSSFVLAQSDKINIIPKPSLVIPENGYFELNRKTKIFAKTPKEREAADFLNDFLSKTYNFKLKVSSKGKNLDNSIVFFGKESEGFFSDEESYRLKIKEGIIIIAANDKGR